LYAAGIIATGTMTARINERQLACLLTCALRYAVDRATYVTDEVATAIREHWHALSDQERAVLERDVSYAVQANYADSESVWKPLLQWMAGPT
jgi:hypothetical protein